MSRVLAVSAVMSGVSAAGLCQAEEPAAPPGATSIASDDASAHLTYATILFYKGLSLYRIDRSSGKKVFAQVEQELELAKRLSESMADTVSRSLVRSHCAFLLGELALNVGGDEARARALYEEALKEFPEHAGATDRLTRLNVKISP